MQNNYQLVETRLQEKSDDGRTVCNLCLWRCRLRHGQRGFCQAHVNRNGTLYNLSYGIVSSADVGPIEDKPVRHFRPGTKVLSVGSYGCNFRCTGCHNLEISWGVDALDELARGKSKAAFVTPEELVRAAIEAGVQGIAFTYSEPAVWLEYVIDVCNLARTNGLYTVYVSNSFVTDEALGELAGRIDVLCSDIKSMEDQFYRNICGKADVQSVLHGIELAQKLGIHVETRTNVIPGLNDDAANLLRIAHWIRDHLGSDSPWHITRFYPAYQLSHIEPTPLKTLNEARQQALMAGLTSVYTYGDKGCDCATENAPVEQILPGWQQLHAVNKCSEDCCGDEGILLKKYERTLSVAFDANTEHSQRLDVGD